MVSLKAWYSASICSTCSGELHRNFPAVFGVKYLLFSAITVCAAYKYSIGTSPYIEFSRVSFSTSPKRKVIASCAVTCSWVFERASHISGAFLETLRTSLIAAALVLSVCGGCCSYLMCGGQGRMFGKRKVMNVMGTLPRWRGVCRGGERKEVRLGGATSTAVGPSNPSTILS